MKKQLMKRILIWKKVWRYIDFSDDAIDNVPKRYKRTALQFAIANRSKDIIKLLANKSGIKQVKVDKNNQIIKKFTKRINESFSDIKFIDKLLNNLKQMNGNDSE